MLREEYVEFGMRSVPPRSEAGKEGDSRRNLRGDYSVWLSGPRLVEKMPRMQELALQALRFSPVVLSGYRNPVHHFVHAGAHARNSYHIYGSAADWAIVSADDRPAGFSAETWFTELFKLTRLPTVDGCWEPASEIRRTNYVDGSLNHAHSDWREMTACAPSWKAR